MKLLAVDSNNQQSKSLKDYNKYITKVRLVGPLIFTFQFEISMEDHSWDMLWQYVLIKYFRTLLERQDGLDDELLASEDEDINVS